MIGGGEDGLELAIESGEVHWPGAVSGMDWSMTWTRMWWGLRASSWVGISECVMKAASVQGAAWKEVDMASANVPMTLCVTLAWSV